MRLRPMTRLIATALLAAVMLTAVPALQAQEFGTVQETMESSSLNLGPRVKAGGLSLLMPGAGQWYNGQRGKSWKFGVTEIGVWTAYLVFNNQRNGYAEDSRDYAAVYADATGAHPESYWRNVGEYMSNEDYNTAQLIDARATGETPALIDGADAWFWRNETFQDNYIMLRSKVIDARERRDFMILFSVLNRVISAFDAVRNAPMGDRLLDLGGFDVELSHSSYQGTSGAVCTFSRKF